VEQVLKDWILSSVETAFFWLASHGFFGN